MNQQDLKTRNNPLDLAINRADSIPQKHKLEIILHLTGPVLDLCPERKQQNSTPPQGIP